MGGRLLVSYQTVTCGSLDTGDWRPHGSWGQWRRVQREVLAKTLRLAITSIALGTIGSLGAARLIASLLLATSPWDPIAFTAMAASLTAIALPSG
jgi:hypothetical protein